MAKSAVLAGGDPLRKIGESWELSTDPAYPSRILAADGSTAGLLSGWLREDPRVRLGEASFTRFGAHCPLLFKWLNADMPLSVQVHPPNGHPSLHTGQCGKPEAWYVARAEAGAFVYLGLRAGAEPASVRAAMAAGDPDSVLFRYVPRVGEYLRIPTGCVHAVGPGLLLAEPQAVLADSEPQTWRLHDWGRRYSASGILDPVNGQERALHLDLGLSAVDWNLPREGSFLTRFLSDLDAAKSSPATPETPFAVQALLGAGQHRYLSPLPGSFSVISVFEGGWEWRATEADVLRLCPGDAVFVPAGASGSLAARGSAARALAVSLDAALVPS